MIDKKKEILGILAGHSSLCWEPKPTGVFDSMEASKAVDNALIELNKLELGEGELWKIMAERNDCKPNKEDCKMSHCVGFAQCTLLIRAIIQAQRVRKWQD